MLVLVITRKANPNANPNPNPNPNHNHNPNPNPNPHPYPYLYPYPFSKPVTRIPNSSVILHVNPFSYSISFPLLTLVKCVLPSLKFAWDYCPSDTSLPAPHVFVPVWAGPLP